MFLQNKYKRWYDALMERAMTRECPSGYTEGHHPFPRALGGPTTRKGTVRLTAREHFVAHWLLTKFTTGEARRKMLAALGSMSMRCAKTGWRFELARAAASKALTGRKLSAETREKVAAANRGKKYPPRSEESREKSRQAMLKRNADGWVSPVKGRKRTAEHTAKIVEARTRNNSWKTNTNGPDGRWQRKERNQ